MLLRLSLHILTLIALNTVSIDNAYALVGCVIGQYAAINSSAGKTSELSICKSSASMAGSSYYLLTNEEINALLHDNYSDPKISPILTSFLNMSMDDAIKYVSSSKKQVALSGDPNDAQLILLADTLNNKKGLSTKIAEKNKQLDTERQNAAKAASERKARRAVNIDLNSLKSLANTNLDLVKKVASSGCNISDHYDDNAEILSMHFADGRDQNMFIIGAWQDENDKNAIWIDFVIPSNTNKDRHKIILGSSPKYIGRDGKSYEIPPKLNEVFPENAVSVANFNSGTFTMCQMLRDSIGPVSSLGKELTEAPVQKNVKIENDVILSVDSQNIQRPTPIPKTQEVAKIPQATPKKPNDLKNSSQLPLPGVYNPARSPASAPAAPQSKALSPDILPSSQTASIATQDPKIKDTLVKVAPSAPQNDKKSTDPLNLSLPSNQTLDSPKASTKPKMRNQVEGTYLGEKVNSGSPSSSEKALALNNDTVKKDVVPTEDTEKDRVYYTYEGTKGRLIEAENILDLKNSKLDAYNNNKCGYVDKKRGDIRRFKSKRDDPVCQKLAQDLVDIDYTIKNKKQGAPSVQAKALPNGNATGASTLAVDPAKTNAIAPAASVNADTKAITPKSTAPLNQDAVSSGEKVYKTYEGNVGKANPEYAGKSEHDLKDLHDKKLALYNSSHCGWSDDVKDIHRNLDKTNDPNCQKLAQELLDLKAAIKTAKTVSADLKTDPMSKNTSGDTAQGTTPAADPAKKVDAPIEKAKEAVAQVTPTPETKPIVAPSTPEAPVKSDLGDKIVADALQPTNPVTSAETDPKTPDPKPFPLPQLAPDGAQADKTKADTKDICIDLYPFEKKDYKGDYKACMNDTNTLNTCLENNESLLADAKKESEDIIDAKPNYGDPSFAIWQTNKKNAGLKNDRLSNRSATIKSILASLKVKCGTLSDACQEYSAAGRYKEHLDTQSRAAWSALLNASSAEKEAKQKEYDSIQADLSELEKKKRVSQFKCELAKGTVHKGDVSGICGHADLFSGYTDLQGENCQDAADSVQATQAISQAADALATSGTAIASQVITMSNDGSQQSSVDAQKKLMITQGSAEIGRATVNAGNAVALSVAAAKANYTKEAMQQAMTVCHDDPTCDAETYRNLQRGAHEAEVQAQAALGKSFMSTLAAASQGVIAAFSFKAANDYKGKDQTGNSNGGVAVSMPIGMGGTTSAVGSPINTVKTDANAHESNTVLPAVPGQVRSGLAGGAPMTAAANSTAAMGTNPGGGGAGGGIGGGGSNNPPSKNPAAGKRLGNTAVGDMAGGSGGAVARNSIAGGLGKDTGPDTTMSEAIKRLMGEQEKAAALEEVKKEEGRRPASVNENQDGSSESFAVPTTVSIFQQVSAKYRQLSNNGAI